MVLLALVACHEPTAVVDPTVLAWTGSVSLDAEFVVESGTTLTIAPGTTVTSAQGVGLVVRGELVARGAVDEPIVFTGDSSAPWGSIVFEAGSVDATFEDVDDYRDGSIVEHAVIEHATRGMHIAGASPYVSSVVFRANTLPATVETIGGAALLVSDGATPRIRDCSFEGNVANVFAFGGAVYVDGADPILQDNVFIGNSSTYGGAVSTDWMASPVVGNHFEGNDSVSEGGAISLVSTISALLADTVVDNHADTDGAGIHVCVTCYPHASPTLVDLVVTGNVSDAASPDEGAAGIGAAFLGGMYGNDVHGNLRHGQASDFGWFHELSIGYPEWVAAPSIGDNWWGTTDLDQVEAAVWDGTDSDRYGIVSLEPIRTEPGAGPMPRVVVASRKQVYEDPGDEVPVFLTLYNPGPAIAASIAITVDGAPFAGELGFPGATRDGDRFIVELPENSVWFDRIANTVYDGSTVDDIRWEATLFDGDDAAIGVPSVARYLFAPAEPS